MGALRTESEKLVLSLENDDALPAYRHDDKFVLFKFPCFFPGQVGRPGRTGLRERFEVTNDRIGDARHPAERAHSQEKIQEMAA